MLLFLSIVVVLIVGYAYFREGVLTAICTLVNVMVAGLIAFEVFEPLANELETLFRGGVLAGFEDAFAMMVPFCATLGVLRLATNNLANQDLDLPPLVNQLGASLVGLVTGYLVAGFLVCVLQTLPWQENFMGFETTVDPAAGGMRRILVPDRVWLAMMHRASAGPLSWSRRTFDPDGTFALRYARLRRFKEDAAPPGGPGTTPVGPGPGPAPGPVPMPPR